MKQVIVVNEALRLPRGKLAAQVAHAAVAAFLDAAADVQRDWVAQGMAKIVLRVDDERALRELHDAARRRHLPAALIEDAGRTVVPAGTVTCVGIGPAPADAIDQVTGDLQLLG